MGQEMSRAHARGYNDGLGGGTYIGTSQFLDPESYFSIDVNAQVFLPLSTLENLHCETKLSRKCLLERNSARLPLQRLLPVATWLD